MARDAYKYRSISDIYLGIEATDICECHDSAADHKVKWLKSHQFSVCCTVPGCKCTTYIDQRMQRARENAALQLQTEDQ